MRIIIALTLIPIIALADDSGDSFRMPSESAQHAGSEVAKSDAQFDKRLPPVLPGEEVSDGKNKMKVWSSSGPLPVAPVPEPWSDPYKNRIAPEVGVVIDQREHQPRGR